MKRETPVRQATLIPFDHIIDDCQVSLDGLPDDLVVDLKKMIESFVYEWDQCFHRKGYYERIDDAKHLRAMVIDSVIAYFLFDSNLPPFSRHIGNLEQDAMLHDIIQGVGELVYRELIVCQPWLPPGRICAIEGWCGDNLVVRISTV